MQATQTTSSLPAAALTPREQQAVEQLAVTSFSRGARWALTLVFVALIVGVPTYEMVHDVMAKLAARERLTREGVAASSLPGRWPRIASLARLLPLPAPQALRAFEDDLLLTSAARQVFQPWTQAAMAVVGVGNRRVVFGRNGWLHYIDGIEYVTGPGFLTPEHLETARANAREGDPRPAILQLQRELLDVGVDLVVLPVPDKAVIVPGTLARDLEGTYGLQNRSWETFVADMRRAGVHVLDITRPMADAESHGTTMYMRADTHWTPAGVDVTARAVAAMLTTDLGMTVGTASRYRRREERVERQTADLPELLALPPSQVRRIGHESILLQQVEDDSGRLWSSTSGSEILLIGDSFSEAWSSSASLQASGLAEQISYYMQRPIERRASHEYNPFDVRAMLGTSRAGVRRAAAGRRVVVFAFAGRKLSFGDWPLLP